jgi:5-methylcytosine-specific restriction endonuclease McrA
MKIGETTKAHIKACSDYKKEFIEKHGFLYCEMCGINHCLAFSVHHIVFASEVPLHKELHNPLNLILLCNKCHDDLHGRKNLRIPLIIKRGLNKLFKLKL